MELNWSLRTKAEAFDNGKDGDADLKVVQDDEANPGSLKITGSSNIGNIETENVVEE